MNQITLPAQELKQALAGLGKVVGRKTTLPVLQTIKLSRAVDGHVSLTATDLDSFVAYQVENPQAGQPIELLLPFEQLNKSLKGSTGEITVTPESKHKAKIRYQIGGSALEQSLTTTPVEEFPPIPNITEVPGKMPANFGETLRQAFETSSTDESRYILHGAYLDVKEPKCHSIVSTNGRCLFAANSFTFDLKSSVNLMRHKFLAWSGFLDGECLLAVKNDKANSSWVKLTTPRWHCTIKQIEGNYPNWRQVVPADTEKWTRVILNDETLAQMLRLSSKLPGDDTDNRTLQIRVGKDLHLEGRNKDDKEFTSAEILGATITGKPVVIGLNREYLQTALQGGLNEIRINNELTPMVFLNGGKKLVVMPVRLNGPTTQVPAKPTTPPASVPPTAETKPAAEESKTNMPKETPKPEPARQPSLLDQLEQVKESAKNLVRDLTGLTDVVKQADKDRRANEKELENARAVLKKLQQVQI